MKILWTFDPFAENKEIQIFGKKILTSISNKNDSIEVVYVASNAEVELATAFSVPLKSRYSSYPKKLITDALKKMNLKKIKVEVIFDKSLSLTSVVKKIIDYTKKKNIDLIVIASNTKKFFPRLVLGSFAESIIHLSVCDLLIFHQKNKFEEKTPDNLLYAYDFSPKGRLGLEHAINYAKKWNATLNIVHIPVPELGLNQKEFKESTRAKVAKLEKSLEKENIKFKVFLEYDVLPTSGVILNIAKKTKADIIAVAAQSNKLEAMLGGSVTRQILRESPLPTLVLKV